MDVPPGVTAEQLTLARCGYRSTEYAKLLIEHTTNASKFDGQVVRPISSGTVALDMPACLVAATIQTHRLKKTETAKTLAKKYDGLEDASEGFCQMLLALNAKDICQNSRNGKLQIDDGVRVVAPGLEKALLERRMSASRTLRMNDKIDHLALATSLFDAVDAPELLQVLPQVRAELIVPTTKEACDSQLKAPFDERAVFDAFLRPNRTDWRGLSLYQRHEIEWRLQVPKVGVVDTGLYSAVLERLTKEGGRSFLISNISKTISSSGNFESDVEPTYGDPYENHGTHVAGLVLGGSAFWKFLMKGKADPAISTFMLGYLPDLVFVKVMSSRVYGETPSISTDAVRMALDHMSPDVDIVNFSHKAPFSEALRDKFLAMTQQQKFVISAAGNDGENMDGYPSDKPQLSAMLSKDEAKFFITVGAADRALTSAAPFSNTGRRIVDLFAPGTCVESAGAAIPNYEYIPLSGTSQAAPLVTFTLSLLKQMVMPREELKFRILATVDHVPALEKKSISGGVLNIPKALEFFDDIVVMKDDPGTNYKKGRLVWLANDKEYADPQICAVPEKNAEPTEAHNTTFRNARRIVINGNVAKVVPVGLGRFEYSECAIDPKAELRLKNTSLPPFKLGDVKEIIPRSKWLKPEKQSAP
jgi:hypothetical protein